MRNYIFSCLAFGLLALVPARAGQVAVGTARVQQVPAINGGATVEGSIHMMSGGAVNLNGGATITGDLLVPGTPTLRVNGNPTFGGTVDGVGAASPSNYTITLNGGAKLGRLLRRTAPVALAPVVNPPAPSGTRSVNLNNAGQSPGAWNTLRDLTLNGNVGQVAVPPGTYGDFTANGGSGFTFGVAGATEAAVYNLQRVNLNGQSQIRVVGPVVLNLRNGFSANGQVGSTEQPAWLTLNIASGDFNLNGGSSLYAVLNAPASGVIINGNSRLVGGLTSKSLIVNGGGLLRLTTGGVTPPVNTAPVAAAQSVTTAEDTSRAITLDATDAEGDALTYTVVTPPTHGILGGTAPNLVYTPAADFHGTDVFSFRVSDGRLDSAVASVSLTITPVNDAPAAQNQALAVTEGELLPIILVGTDKEGSALTYTILAAPGSGTLSGDAPNLTYAPPANTDETATFTFKVNDGELDSAPATVSIAITNRNIAPVASGAERTVVEDEPLAIELAATDADGDALTYALQTPPTRGAVNIVGHVATYTPGANAVGADAFMFSVSDGLLTSSPAMIALTITPVNDVPVAAGQTLVVDEDAVLAVVLSGDDVDGGTLAYAVVTPPAHGVLSGVAPNLTYTPAGDFHGVDEFAFTVADAATTSAPATIAITVRPLNDAPVALAQNLTVNEGDALAITLTASDADGDMLSYALIDVPALGTLTLAPGAPANGPNYLYTPPANQSGVASFTFRVNDGAAESEAATITITYSNINDAPVASGSAVELDEDASVTFVLTATDPDGGVLSYAITAAPTHGVVTVEGNQATYVPAANFHGADEFAFTATDNGEPALVSAPATIAITVRPVNDAPTAEALVSSTAEDTDLALALVGVDVDGDEVAYEIVTAPAHGALSGTAPGLVYTPAGNFNGADAFTYRVSDGQLASAATLVAITVTPVNDAPVAQAAGFAVTEGEVLPILLTATDVDGDVLSYELVTSPARGVLSGEPPMLSYAPPANTDALVEFTFIARDGAVASAPATVSIEIRNRADAPISAPQALKLAEDTSLAFVLSASDPDGDTLAYEVIVPPEHGMLGGAAPEFTYTPDANFHGVDTLLFVARDAAFESAPAMVTLTVTPVNDAPVAAGQALTTEEDSALPIILAGVDSDGDALMFSIVDAPAHGVLSGEAPNLLYTPTADYHGADAFTFTVSDGELVSERATIGLTITPGNDAPMAPPQSLTLAEDTPLAITLAGSDPDGDALSYQVMIAPERGVLGGEAPNITYTPAENYHGADAFVFTVSDGVIVSAAATVALTITPVNDALVAQSGNVTVAANASVAIPLFAIDPDGDTPLSYEVVQGPAHGTLGGVAPTLVYEPDYGYDGPDEFLFTASDGVATSAPQSVSITVAPAAGNQAPRVTLDAISPAPLPLTAFELVAFARDADGGVALVEYFVDGAPIGSATRPVAGDATRFAFLIERGLAEGTYAFTARVTDDQGATAMCAPLSLTIAYDPNARTFTSTADFEEGVVRTLKSAGDELTTALLPSAFDYVWVSNSSAGTIVRIDSETGRVVGVYRSAPEGSPAFPSSIAVDSQGNAWVANRSGNSVVKIGLGVENGAWVDRNQDLVPNTSEGQGDILPWPAGGQPTDEHILLRVETAVTGLDHIAVDANDNVWVGGYGGKWQLIDGETGAILREENHPGGGVGGRGGFIDLEGVQVSTGMRFMRWDTKGPTGDYDRAFSSNVRAQAWGVARDAEGNYWVTQDWSPVVEKYSATGEKLGTYKHGSQWGQGIMIDGDGHIWVAHSHCGDTVGHLLPDGTWIGNVKVANHGPTEVSVDRLGRIWVVSTTGVVERINPLGGKIGLDGVTPVGEVDLRSPQLGGTLWTYGRFVGDVQRLGFDPGVWIFDHDSQIPAATWGPVLWNAILANDAVISVEVCLGENGTSYGPWQTLTLESPMPLGVGRHLRGRVNLKPSSDGDCPVLFDLTVGTAGYREPVIARRWLARAGEDQSANWPDKVQLKGATWHSAHAWNETPAYQWTFVEFTPLAVGGGTAPTGGSVVFSDASDPRSQAQFSGVGEYRLRLTSTLHGISSSDEVLVLLTPYNKLPYVSASEHLFLRDHTENAILDGVARDDGLPLGGTFTSTWEKAFGPGNVAFADANSPVTTATFDAPGLYVLRIRGNDGELQSTSGMSVYAGLECSEAPPRGLISWWQANGGGSDHISGNQAFPEQGANYAEGYAGPAFNFDGVNDRVHVFGNDTMNVGVRDGLGLEFWVRPADSREATLLEYGSGASIRGVSVRQSGTALVVDFKDAAGVSHLVTLNSALPANTWTHLSINYDRASGWVYLFRNGEWSFAQHVGIFELQTSYDFRMGVSWTGDRPFKGLLDEVSLYDRGLTHAEAWRIYADGRAGKRRPVTNAAPVVNAGGDYIALYPGSPVRLRGSVIDDGMPLYQTVRPRWTMLAGPVDATVDFADATDPRTTATFNKPGLYTIQLEADDGAFCTKKTSQVRVAVRDSVETPAGLMAWWPGNQTTEEMVSGRVEPGVNVGYASGKVGSAYEFDQANRRVVVEGAPEQTNLGVLEEGFTIEFWMQSDLLTNSSQRRLLSWAKGTTENAWVYTSTNGVAFGPGVGAYAVNGLLSGWNHVGFAYEKGTTRLLAYLNGALISNWVMHPADVERLRSSMSGVLYIGGSPFHSAALWHDGGLDEITFYDRPLNPSEISVIYTAGSSGKRPAGENEPPMVSAGADQGITSVTGTATLHGQVSDDGLPSGELAQEWTQVFGPEGVSIATRSEAQTEVSFIQAGHYGFKLMASDGLAAREDTVEVRVAATAGPTAPSGLIAWWPGNGTTEEWVSGRQEIGVNVAYASAGKVGPAYEFDQTNRRVVVEGASGQTNLGVLEEGFTIELWIRSDLMGDGNQRRLLSWANGMAVGAYIHTSTNGVTLCPGSGAYAVNGLLSGWNHVGFAYEKGTTRLRAYLNGALIWDWLVHPADVERLQSSMSGVLYIGGSPFHSAALWHDGGLDEITFYDRPLNPSEISVIYTAGSSGKRPAGENEPPMVSAGADQGITSVTGTATLHGQVSDDGLPSGELAQEWSQVFGPEGANIAMRNDAQTAVGFTQAGHYGFTLTASDGLAARADTVEVRVAAAAGPMAPSGLIAWWPGNGTTEESVSSRLETGVNVGYTAAGKVGPAYEFDQTSRCVMVEGAAEQTNLGMLENGFTIELWMRSDLMGDGNQRRLLSWAKGTTENAWVYTSTNGVTFGPGVGAYAVNGLLSGWNHVGFAYEKGTTRLLAYLNGALISNWVMHPADVERLRSSMSGVLYMGGNPFQLSRFWHDGGLDEITFYDRPLSQREMNAIYVAGSSGKQPERENEAPVVSAGADQGITSPTGTVTLHGQVRDDGLPSSELAQEWTQIFGPEGATIATRSASQTEVRFAQAGHYGFKLTASDGLAARADMVEVRVAAAAGPSAPSGLVAWWPGNGTTEENVSGRLETGVNIGYAAGKVGPAYEFDQTSRRVVVEGASGQTNLGVLENGFTIELWIRSDLLGDVNPRWLLSWVNETTEGAFIYTSTNGVTFGPGSGTYGVTGLQPGWNHVGFAYEKGTTRLLAYLNGALISNWVMHPADVERLRSSMSGVLYMGGNPFRPATFRHDGGLDEVSFYDRALTPTEIATIYSAGAAGKAPVQPPPVVQLTAPVSSGLHVEGAPLVFQATAYGRGDPIASVAFYDGATLLGSVSEADVSSEAVFRLLLNSGLGLGTHTLTAVATDTGGVSARSAPVVIEVTHAPPTVALLSHAEGSSVPARLPLTLGASASYTGGPLARVEFYSGTTKLGEATQPDVGSLTTYSFTYDAGLSPGPRSLTAKAIAGDGASNTSAPVNVLAEVVEPVVTISAPLDGAQIVSNSALTVRADATVAAGSIERVEFYAGSLYLGAATAPVVSGGTQYQFTHAAGLPVGPHVLTARAIAALSGATTTSPPVAVTATTYSGPEVVELVAPFDGERITSPTEITGIVARPSLASWKIEYRLTPPDGVPASSAPWATLVSGFGYTGTPAIGGDAAVPALLGTFDPARLPNGLYQLRLSATANNGSTLRDFPRTVLVDGKLKLGAVDSTVLDLEIPAPGFPLRIERRYSSLDKSIGDFGPGTTLAASSVRLQVSQALGADWFGYTVAGPLGIPLYRVDPAAPEDATGVPPAPRVVAITLADQTVLRFAAELSPRQQIVPITGARLVFKPLAGTTGTLVPLGASLGLADEVVLSNVTDYLDLLDPEEGFPLAPAAYRLTTLDGTQYIIDAAGGLLFQRDPNGNSITYTRDAIIHSNGLRLTLTRDAAGRITRVTDPAGRQVNYTYDAAGRLISATDATGQTTGYGYVGATSLVASIQPPAAVLPTYNVFDALERFVARVDALQQGTTLDYDPSAYTQIKRDPLGHETAYQYDTYGNVTAITDPLGHTTRHLFGDARFPDLATQVTNHLGQSVHTTYNAQGRAATITDPLGRVTTYAYDAAGRRLSETDPLGRAVVRAYDAKGNVLSVTDRTGAVTRYTYDASGNPLTVTDPLNNVSTFSYNSLGLPLTELERDGQGDVISRRAFAYDAAGNLTAETLFQTDANGVAQPRVTAYTHDSAGRIRTITHPDGRVVTRTYTPVGNLATETTPENGLTTYTYDAIDRLVRIDFANGSHEATAYDAAGRITSRTDRGGFTTSYVHDAAGRLVSETLPDGGVIERTYDAAGRLVSETDDAGRVTATTYDAAGNPTGITHPDGTATTLVYDAADNVLTRTVRAFAEPEFATLAPLARSVAALGGEADEHRLAQSTGGGGSPLSLTGGAPARLFRFAYDANRRLTEVIHPDGITKATIAYDVVGRPTRVVNERGAVWTYEYQGASAMRRTRVVGPEGYAENYEYDELANITAQIDGRGRRMETSYDVFKPTQIRYRGLGADASLFTSVFHTYDEKGRLQSIRDRRAFDTIFAYPTANESDREISRAEGPGASGQTHVTREDYDARGNLLSVTDARGSITRYEYDYFNRRILVAHPDGVRERTIYGPGNTVARTELVSSAGDVLATAYGYDANGRLTSVTHPDGAEEGFTFDADGRLTRRIDERGHATVYKYDDVARSVTVTDAEGGVTRHRFDAVGNLLETTDARGHRTAFAYDLLGRQTSRTEAAGTNVARTTRFAYDLNGNVVARIEASDTPDARTTTYAYDADNRLLLTTFPDGSTVRTEHDADGNLVLRTDERGYSTHHDYDAFGRITRLTDALQNATTYAYPGFGARTERTDPLNRVYTDHFDTRQRLTLRESDGGAWLENLAYDAFGRLASRTERRASSVSLSAARATAFAYDDRGRVSTVTHPSGGVERFDYDDAGNLAALTDPRGFVTAFTHDRLNRRTLETRSGAANETARATSFAYDPVGNLTALTRPGGQLITRTYDQLNRPQVVTVTLNATETYSRSILHDVFDRVYAIEDARGRNEFAYDSRDRLLTETDALGHTRRSNYDAAGNRLTATDERGFTASFTHDALGRVVSAAIPGGATRAYQFDAAGRLSSTTITGLGTALDEAAASPDRTTRFGYDGLDRLVRTEELDTELADTVLAAASTTYDGAGRLLGSTDGESFTTAHAYSPGGFLQSVTFPDGTSRSWTHDLAGNVLTVTDELGKTTAIHTYNGFGEVASITDALLRATTFDHDVEGRLIAVHAPLGRTTTHAYDLAGRRVSTGLPDGTALAFAYDLFGNLTRRTDQLDRDTTYTYDALDRLLSVTAPISATASATASYTYDPAGNLTTITDPLNQLTRFEHDAAGRLAATYLPLRPTQAHEHRTYDHSGNLIDLADGNGHVTRHTYDARGLLTSVQPDGAFGQASIRHTYDARGLRTTMTDRLGVTAYAHDARGRLTSKSTPYAGRLSYGYDDAGRLASLVSSGSGGVNVAYGYDAADRLVSANDARFGVTSYGYDAADRLATQTLPSGLHTTHGYDAMDRLLSAETRVSDSPAAAVVEAYTYTRTLTGQIASELSAGGRAETYAYDHSDRLVQQVISGDSSGQNGTLVYTLDAIGNRLARASTVPGLPSQDFGYDANHAIEGYDYDDQGNPVAGAAPGSSPPASGSIADSYDFRHALAARQSQVTYLYDGDGERVGRRVWNPVALAWDDTYYLNDSLPSAANPLGLSQTIEERAPGGALQRLYSPAPRRLAVAERHVLASSGGAFSVALAADGTVLAWGDHSAGQLGDGGATSARPTPALVPGLSNITRVVAGSEFAAALRSDGALLWWGHLGSAAQSAPTALAGLPPLASVAAGADFLVALAADGTVWTFGDNSSGQLGSGGFGSASAPVQVAGLTDIAEVAAGAVHALALDASGQVHAWGGNTVRQLGDPAYTSTASTLPLAVPGLADVVELSGGARHTLALDLAGVVYAWGDNSTGQLGDGTRTIRAAAEPVVGLGQSAVSVAAGGWHSLAALADGTVRAWGSHAEGQSAGALSAATDDQLTPALVNGLIDITRVAAGARHSLARSGTGQWYGWGSNRDGQLGLTGTVGGATPAVLAATGLADVVGGIDAASGLAIVQAQRYYGYDAQGSVRYQTDAAGAVTARYGYDAFGTLLATAGESPLGSDAYLYRGERYDALTGLYHLRARDYDPALGRFHQIDDFAGFADNPYSLNRYNYAESNPVGKHDPAGRFAVTTLGTAMMALHIKGQYLDELASAGPRFDLDIDEALNRYLMTDGLVSSSVPLKLKERELWVRSSGGGLLGSWVNESGSSQQSETMAGRGSGAGSDVFFLHQSGARFRQGWALRSVEQAWGALQQSRANLNLGPRLPDDPRSARITAGNVSLKGARWADAIYADALLQATLRSATEPGRGGVRARFTATLNGRRYDATGQDLTAAASRALNSAAGGGPVDWEAALPAGPGRFIVAPSVGSLESPVTEEFARAISRQSMLDTWLHAATAEGSANAFSSPAARGFGLARDNDMGMGLSLGVAFVSGTPWAGDIVQDGYTFNTGLDFMSGEKVAGWRRGLSGAALALELFPGLGGVVADSVGGLAKAGVRGSRATLKPMVRVGSSTMSIAGEAAQAGLRQVHAAGKSVLRAGAQHINDAFLSGRGLRVGGLELVPSPLKFATDPSAARTISNAAERTTSPILQTQRQLSQLVNKQGAVVDRWLATSGNRWAQTYRAHASSNPNFAKGIRGRVLDSRMRGKFRDMFGDVPGVRIDQTIPGAGNALRPDLYFPNLGGRRVIFDVGGPSKVGDISKYGGMADDLIPLIPEQWF